jgi:hypothetical protein
MAGAGALDEADTAGTARVGATELGIGAVGPTRGTRRAVGASAAVAEAGAEVTPGTDDDDAVDARAELAAPAPTAVAVAVAGAGAGAACAGAPESAGASYTLFCAAARLRIRAADGPSMLGQGSGGVLERFSDDAPGRPTRLARAVGVQQCLAQADTIGMGTVARCA